MALVRICRVLVVLVTGLMASACSEDPEALARSAAVRAAAGDYKGAIIELKSAVRARPEDGALRYELGKLYNASFDPAPAEKELRAASRLGVTDHGRVAVELARSLRAQGKFQSILDDIHLGDDEDTENNATLSALRGRAEHALGKRENAETSLARARELQADNADAIMLDAQILVGQRKLDEALGKVQGLLDREPDHFDAWSYKAELLRGLGREDDAVAAYGKLLKLNPRYLPALVNRSAVLIGLGKLEEAAKDVATLREAYRGHPKTQVQAGVLALANGRPREALDAARAALKVAPDLASATLLAGLASQGLGQYEQAEQMLKAHLAATPADAYARRVLGETQIALQQPAAALETLKPLLELGTDDARVYAAAANAATALGDKARATVFFEKAASISPSDNALQVQRAIARIGSGEFDIGVDELKRALADSSEPSRADEYLVLTLLQQGKAERALEEVQALEQRAPDSAVAANLRGLVMMATGELQAGKRAFETALEKDATFLPAVRNLVQFDLGAGDFEAARGRYAKVLSAEEGNLEAQLSLADLELQLHNLDGARAAYERAASLSPGAVEPRKKLVALYLSTGESQKAAELAASTLRDSRSDAALILLAAQAQQQSGNANQANETIRQLIATHGDQPLAHIRVAEFLAAAGQPDEAIAVLRNALKGQPDNVQFRVALASQLVAARRFDDAQTLAQETRKGMPTGPLGELLEGEIQEAQGNFAEAAERYRAALAKQATGEVAVKLFLAEARGGEQQASFERLMEWADRHPADTASRLFLGNFFLGRGDYKQAAAQYELIIAAKQGPLEVLNNLAYAYQKLGDEQAMQYAFAAFQAAPNSPMVVDTLGWIFLERGDVPQALSYLRRAALLAPDQPEIQYHLALAQQRSGDKAAARAAVEKALAATGSFPSREAASALRDSL